MFSSIVVIGSTIVHKYALVLHLSSRSVYIGFFIVHCSPSLLTCRHPLVVLINFSICFFINSSMRPGQVLSKPSFIALRMIFVGDIKSAAWEYCAGYGLVIWARMFFTSSVYCCVSMRNFHILVDLFLLPFNICCQFCLLTFIDVMLFHQVVIILVFYLTDKVFEVKKQQYCI